MGAHGSDDIGVVDLVADRGNLAKLGDERIGDPAVLVEEPKCCAEGGSIRERVGQWSM